MDELTLRLECLKAACQARTSQDVVSQAKTFYDWVTNMGQIAVDEYRPNFDLTELQIQQVKDIVADSPVTLGDEEKQAIVDEIHARVKRIMAPVGLPAEEPAPQREKLRLK